MSSGLSDYFQQLAEEWRQSDAYKTAIAEAREYNNLLDDIWKQSVVILDKLTIREFMNLVNMSMCDLIKMGRTTEPDQCWREEASKLLGIGSLRKLHEKLCK